MPPLRESLIEKIQKIDDSDIKGLFLLGINALDNPAQKPMVNGALQKVKYRIKKRNYPNRNQLLDIAIEVSRYIFDSDPQNYFYLQKLCEFLGFRKGYEDEIISNIKEFFQRVLKEDLDQDTIDFLTITLASAYASKGNNKRAIIELEAINSKSTRVLDNLARFYYYDRRPQKAIDLLENLKFHRFLRKFKDHTNYLSKKSPIGMKIESQFLCQYLLLFH